VGGLQLWGGHECTINRVGVRYMDQSILSGHTERPADLELFAGLGITSLRYPVLWERVSPERPDQWDFSLADERLGLIREHGMQPIVGLCHHGSGPVYTSLLEDTFAPGLALHARATAERYPWVLDWTPVNEPLTTARFSALYGIWYPHVANEGAFWRALLNEIDAVRLSMREIRRVQPQARLVQTEDLGFCHATPAMAAQAEFENERRWITWDLLCGRVTDSHPLWDRIARWGLEPRLHAIADDPCPPDILGVNHYLSSDRLLDHRVELYPPGLLGGDGPGPYVNIEAVRTIRGGGPVVGELLRQTWERYGRPIAITECHNGCTREEQMRWFLEVWRAAQAAFDAGIDVRAVTAWALMGSFDWHRLLSVNAGHYESGVFDVGSGAPEPTAMSRLLQDLAAGRNPDHPVLAGEGWWRREDRFYAQALEADAPQQVVARAPDPVRPAPLLVAGPAGARRSALAETCRVRGLAFEILDVGSCDPDAAAREIQRAATQRGAWAVIELAAFSAWDAPGVACARWLERDHPWRPGTLDISTGELMSEVELRSFVDVAMEHLEMRKPFHAAADSFAPGACLSDAAHKILDLLVDGRDGRIVLTAPPGPSWAELAATVARQAGFDPYGVEPVCLGRRRSKAGSLRAVPLEGAETLVLPPLAAAAAHAVSRNRLVAAGRQSCPPSASARQETPMLHAAE
jgi:dTDP-4-dehydrorhamnose reductase